MPQVTVCIPVYNVEGYIERCVRSICEQTLEDLEIIFINDCSPDNSWNIIKSTLDDYPNRKSQVILLENNINVGPGVSRQRCAQKATGEYIYFADSDDWLDKDMLKTMYVIACENNADLIGCQVNFIHQNGNVCSSNFQSNFTKNEWISKLLMPINNTISIALWTRLIRRSVYIKTFVEESEIIDLVRYEDFINIIKCHFYACKILWIERPLYNHDTSNSKSVTKINDNKSIESCIRVATMLENFFKSRNISLYDFEIDYFKINAKNRLILSKDVFDPVRWKTLWPDLISHPMISKKTRILMSLADKEYFLILRLILFSYKMARLLYKRNNCKRPKKTCLSEKKF